MKAYKLSLKNFVLGITLLIGLGFFGARFFLKNSTLFQKESSSQKPLLLVSVLPQKQIVERVAGEEYEVVALIPPGFNPATYDPTPSQMKKISQAKMYFRIGKIPFEQVHLSEITSVNPDLEVIDTSVNNQFRVLEAHQHEGEEQEYAEEFDPHIWLAPLMVRKQAEVIANALVTAYPEKSEFFKKNYQNLAADLDELDRELQTAFAPIKGQTMLVYHPAFGYLADAYGFHQEHIEIEGQQPSIQELQSIINEAKAAGVKVIFVQKQFSQDSAQAIADNISGAVVAIDPLNPEYLENMKNLAHNIAENLQ